MARNVYYPYDFEAHKNLSHKQFPIEVYYFMNGALLDQYETIVFVVGFLNKETFKNHKMVYPNQKYFSNDSIGPIQ